MKQELHEPLDAFEAALLRELKLIVARSPGAASVPSTRRRSSWLRARPWYALAAATTLVALAAILTVVNMRPTPAYAVSGGVNDEVTVRVNRLEGADTLERALRVRGIAADITYLPDGMTCAPGRYQERATPGLLLSAGTDWFEVKIPPRSVGPHDTLVLAAAVTPMPDQGSRRNVVRVNVSFGIATGPVAPCRAIPAR